jgi:hypothetical protein
VILSDACRIVNQNDIKTTPKRSSQLYNIQPGQAQFFGIIAAWRRKHADISYKNSEPFRSATPHLPAGRAGL